MTVPMISSVTLFLFLMLSSFPADGKDTAYFCDSFGFTEMPEFFKEKELVQEKSETAKGIRSRSW